MPKHRKDEQADSSDYDEDVVKKKKKITKGATPKKKAKKADSENESVEPAKPKKASPQKAAKQPPVKDDKKDFMVGQKYQIPQQEDGARAFYVSLFEQNPNSEIAKRYCLEYGLLEPDIAPKIFKQLNRK